MLEDILTFVDLELEFAVGLRQDGYCRTGIFRTRVIFAFFAIEIKIAKIRRRENDLLLMTKSKSNENRENNTARKLLFRKNAKK